MIKIIQLLVVIPGLYFLFSICIGIIPILYTKSLWLKKRLKLSLVDAKKISGKLEKNKCIGVILFCPFLFFLFACEEIMLILGKQYPFVLQYASYFILQLTFILWRFIVVFYNGFTW